jgi:RNA polymerase sigma factor (sigma-70 family)
MMCFMATEATMPRPHILASEVSLDEKYHRLLADNGPSLRRLAASYTRTASDSKDLFQDIAMALWQALPAFRGESSERTYLFRIAHNRAMAFVSRRRPLLEPVEDDTDAPGSRPGPEEQYVRRQQQNRLIEATRHLPLPYRQVITLALEGMDYVDIAAVLGIEINNVGVRLTRARGLLRTLMENTK